MNKGRKNSSATYVRPAFTAIRPRIDHFVDWLNRRPGSPRIDVNGADWQSAIVRFADSSGKGEQGLPPARSLLKWMVYHAGISDKLADFKWNPKVSDESNHKREILFTKDSPLRLKVVAEAIDKINSGKTHGWFALEGSSKPDVYVETNKFILVVEGKRTELRKTETTRFFKKDRDQLIRHMDSAVECAGNKPVYGLFITERDYKTEGYARLQYFRDAMPHRTEAECKMIKHNLLPELKWDELQAAMKKIGIIFNYIESM